MVELIASALVLVAAPAALPERGAWDIPGGHLYAGLEVALDQPLGRALKSGAPLGGGGAFGLVMTAETETAVLTGELVAGQFAHDDTFSNPFMLALRCGPVLSLDRFAPYAAVGPALLAYGAVGDDAAGAWGVSGELGVLVFRDARWLRLTPYIQYNQPLIAEGGKGVEHVMQLGWLAAGLRVQF